MLLVYISLAVNQCNQFFILCMCKCMGDVMHSGASKLSQNHHSKKMLNFSGCISMYATWSACLLILFWTSWILRIIKKNWSYSLTFFFIVGIIDLKYSVLGYFECFRRNIDYFLCFWFHACHDYGCTLVSKVCTYVKISLRELRAFLADFP